MSCVRFIYCMGSMTKEKSNERKNVHTSFYRFSVTSFNFFLSLSLLWLYNCFRFVVHRDRRGEGELTHKKAEKSIELLFLSDPFVCLNRELNMNYFSSEKCMTIVIDCRRFLIKPIVWSISIEQSRWKKLESIKFMVYY